jgi:hypothetical protein
VAQRLEPEDRRATDEHEEQRVLDDALTESTMGGSPAVGWAMVGMRMHGGFSPGAFCDGGSMPQQGSRDVTELAINRR